MSQRQQFIKSVTKAMEQNDRVVLLLGDISVFAFKSLFDRWPTRCFNIGICEQSIVSIAAGMAKSGLIPIVHTIAPFLVRRAYEQMCIDFGYQKLPGVFVSVGASFDYGTMGCTHHCPEDIELMKAIPGMSVYVPWDDIDFDTCFRRSLGGLSYIRISETPDTPLAGAMLGRTTVQNLASKEAPTVVVVGPMLPRTLRAVSVISPAENIDIRVLYYSQVSPLDTYALLWHQSEYINDNDFELSKNPKKILLVEPYYEGTLAREIVKAFSPFPVILKTIGVKREFSRDYGTLQDHERANNMTEADIAAALKELINA